MGTRQSFLIRQENNYNRRLLLRNTLRMTFLVILVYAVLIISLRFIHSSMLEQRRRICKSYASVGNVLIEENLRMGGSCDDVTTNFKRVEQDIQRLGYHYRLLMSEDGKSFQLIAGKHEPLTDPVVDRGALGKYSWRIEVMPKNGWRVGTLFQIFTAMGVAIALVLLSVIGMAFRSKRLHTELQMYASRDPLTNVMSRGAFTLQAESQIRQNPNSPYTYLTIDIDDFKLVNDVYGHDAGDRALKVLGKQLVDIFGEFGLTGRVGGDEFAVVLFDKTAAEARERIESIQRRRFTFIDGQGRRQYFTISIGYADAPAQGKSLDMVRELSDVALYSVKLHGKHGCMYYDDSMGVKTRDRLGFSLRDVGENIPGALFVYRADDSQEILYANRLMIELMGCESTDEFMEYTKGSFRGIVQPRDYEKMERLIEEQIAADDGKTDTIEYEVIPKRGNPFLAFDVGRLVEHERYGKVFYVIIVKEFDLE